MTVVHSGPGDLGDGCGALLPGSRIRAHRHPLQTGCGVQIPISRGITEAFKQGSVHEARLRTALTGPSGQSDAEYRVGPKGQRAPRIGFWDSHIPIEGFYTGDILYSGPLWESSETHLSTGLSLEL